jgi:hypothetical protein
MAMEIRSTWYKDIAKQINRIKDLKGEKNLKKYKLDFLLCLTQRVDSFSSLCSECQMFKQEISKQVSDLADFAQMPGDSIQMPKEKRRAYLKTIDKITGHLQKQHKLVVEGQHLGLWMSIGTAIGVPLGAFSDNVGLGIPIGIAIGLAIGSYLDNKAKKEGRIICPRQTSGFSKNTAVALVILGLLVLVGGLLLFLYRSQSGE